MKQKKVLGDSRDTLTIYEILLNFPPDPQTLPSQTTLDLIVNNSLGKSILTEALNRCSLSTNGIEQRFRLTNMRELATDRTPLLSFMFYTGALTYEQNLSPASSKHNFKIPNCIAEKEFVTDQIMKF